MSPASLLLALFLTVIGSVSGVRSYAWKRVSILEFGAVGDNATDNTKAFRSALLAVVGGGELLVPGPAATAVFRTAPINLTSNVVLRVEGTLRAVEDREAFPQVAVLPSYGSCCADEKSDDYDDGTAHYNAAATRVHPFVWTGAGGGHNITITGKGIIDGAGAYWWPAGGSRPHLLELYNVSGAEVTGVTLLNSAFWTFHPVYCSNLHIHHMEIQVPWLAHVPTPHNV